MDARPNRQLLRVGLGAAVGASSPDRVLPPASQSGGSPTAHVRCLDPDTRAVCSHADTTRLNAVSRCTRQIVLFMVGNKSPTRNGSLHPRTALHDDGRVGKEARRMSRPRHTWSAVKAGLRNAPHAADPTVRPLQRPVPRYCPIA